MRTKNAASFTRAESAHLAKVKATSCALCDGPAPVEAHHVEQGQHFTSIGVCPLCHRGPHGIHGDQTMLRLRFKTAGLRAELAALNLTLGRVAALENS
ncbi:hypothetical protein [Arenimonas alkanexedens]